MKIKSKVVLATIASIILFASTNVFAYQSTPAGSAVTGVADNFITGVRSMERQNGGMGLAETYNGTTLKSSTASNHVDVHMQKNTEYGAVLILSASYYGKHGTGTNVSEYINTTTTGLATTTGNVYGIYQMGSSNEVTATTYTTGWRSGVLSRYINRYDGTTTYFAGDAISETAGWKGSSSFGLPSNNNALWRNYFNGGNFSATDTRYGMATSRACMIMSSDYNV